LKASADEFIHLFVDQGEWLTKFLEFITQKNLGSPMVYNTLLELYLRPDDPNDPRPPEVREEARQERRKKAMNILSQTSDVC
jgi:hypothetical protein